ncbi:hypothetical protein CsSME_00032264 [Camellia sinensis var. sinensis]
MSYLVDILDKRNQKVQDNNQRIVEEEDLALLLFDLATVSSATNNFSLTNKIGEGGFGPVYQGELTTGREIAVKRLSKTSGQVKLLGCCIHEEERMLIYEYMPNKNQIRGKSFDWKKHFDIIVGIARGLLYLHRDSRLRVIHRDLKAGNILLDSEMNPKIADFGLARSFGGDQFEENTDSIVSGKKNRGFYDPDYDLNLLGHVSSKFNVTNCMRLEFAWKLWNEGNPIKLFDVFMEDPVPTSEVFRCIQVALLCVQQHPKDRPTMSAVLLMLDSENPVVITNIDYLSTGKHHCTTNEVTITMLHGR